MRTKKSPKPFDRQIMGQDNPEVAKATKKGVQHAKLAATRKTEAKRLGKVAQVWALCDKLGAKAERKDVIEAGMKQGLNKATIATQYQAWRKATPAQRKEKVKVA